MAAPQGCVLSLLLYSHYTYDCVATHESNTIVKFVVVIGLVTKNDEKAYVDEVDRIQAYVDEVDRICQ